MNEKNLVRLKVWGNYACFTRPALKVERMTYPCMTPSAARGILDGILWKPEFKWHIHKISVLEPVRFISVKRNEINTKQAKNPIHVDELDNRGKPKFRAQRNSIVLQNVAYIIEAEVVVEPYSEKNPPRKYVEMFNRRILKGQCYRRPYLGCREFSAEFGPPAEGDTPIKEDLPIGAMFLDMVYDENGKPAPKYIYNAALGQGVLDCSDAYAEILPSTHFQTQLPESVLYPLHQLAEEEGL